MIVWNEFRNDARVLKEAKTLQFAGCQVTVHALHTPGVTLERETLACGVKVVRVARSPLWKLRKKSNPVGPNKNMTKAYGPIGKVTRRKQLLRFVARAWTHMGLLWKVITSKPDVVHAHDVNTLPTAWLASVLSRSKLIYDAHEISTDREGYASFRRMVGWVEKKLMPCAVGTITTTDTRAKFFAMAYKVPRPIVLQNRPQYAQRAPKTEKIREYLGLSECWPIVLYQGGLQQGRGLERIVDAALQIENAYFVFIGGGRLELLLKEKTIQLGLEKRVHFIDTVSLDELPHYTASADIGLQPIENTCLNHYSTDSNKLFEYMMAGLPVVATSLPEVRKIIKQNEFGLLVTPGDTNSLVAAIRQLVENEELRNTLRKNSIKTAEKLNWEEQEGKLLALYKKISGREK